jgi:hypothetical protein
MLAAEGSTVCCKVEVWLQREAATVYTTPSITWYGHRSIGSGVSGVGNVIRYVITVRGPRPVGYVYAPLDYPHYIRKQLLPIARSLVPFVVIDEALFGSGQMALF